MSPHNTAIVYIDEHRNISIHPKASKHAGTLRVGNLTLRPEGHVIGDPIRQAIRRHPETSILGRVDARLNRAPTAALKMHRDAVPHLDPLLFDPLHWRIERRGLSGLTIARLIGVALGLTVLLWNDTAGAEPSPTGHYPAAHDNLIAADPDNCRTIDGHITACQLAGGPRWVNLSNGDQRLATGTWTLDTPDAKPWLRVRNLDTQTTTLIAPSSTQGGATLTGPDTSYHTTNTELTRPEYRQTANTLTGT